MTHQEEYRGHHIAVDILKIGGGYLWAYQIDGGPIRTCQDRPLNDLVMLAEGIACAKAEIDRTVAG
jgi:hypothetical protein